MLHCTTVRIICLTQLFWIKFLAVIDSLEKASVWESMLQVFHIKYYPVLGVENLNMTLYEIPLLITMGTWKLECFTETMFPT